MPVASEITNAAANFGQNAGMLDKSFTGLSAADWAARPSECCNSMLWVAGHIVWARSRTLSFMGVEWSKPWLAHYARGKAGDGETPTPEEMLSAWAEVKTALNSALHETSPQRLAGPGPEKVPSFDGTLAGTLAFMASHESYHVGQAAYLHKWLGHGQVAG